jgi:hypothetical protein
MCLLNKAGLLSPLRTNLAPAENMRCEHSRCSFQHVNCASGSRRGHNWRLGVGGHLPGSRARCELVFDLVPDLDRIVGNPRRDDRSIDYWSSRRLGGARRQRVLGPVSIGRRNSSKKFDKRRGRLPVATAPSLSAHVPWPKKAKWSFIPTCSRAIQCATLSSLRPNSRLSCSLWGDRAFGFVRTNDRQSSGWCLAARAVPGAGGEEIVEVNLKRITTVDGAYVARRRTGADHGALSDLQKRR